MSVLLVMLKSHGLTQMAAQGLILCKTSAQSVYNKPNKSKSPFSTYVHIYKHNPFLTRQKALHDHFVTTELLWALFQFGLCDFKGL